MMRPTVYIRSLLDCSSLFLYLWILMYASRWYCCFSQSSWRMAVSLSVLVQPSDTPLACCQVSSFLNTWEAEKLIQSLKRRTRQKLQRIYILLPKTQKKIRILLFYNLHLFVTSLKLQLFIFNLMSRKWCWRSRCEALSSQFNSLKFTCYFIKQRIVDNKVDIKGFWLSKPLKGNFVGFIRICKQNGNKLY